VRAIDVAHLQCADECAIYQMPRKALRLAIFLGRLQRKEGNQVDRVASTFDCTRRGERFASSFFPTFKLSTMQFELKQAVALLAQTPLTLRSMLGGLSAEWTHGGSADNWSPYDVVGHLIHGEMTDWIPRARIILEHGADRAFTPFDRLAQFDDSGSLAERLDTFARLRKENLQALESMSLTPETLALKGQHPELGKVDLSQLLSTWAVHDLNHIRQIVKFMAEKFSGNVGPWKQYLSILQQ
jgi:hypothetical protein